MTAFAKPLLLSVFAAGTLALSGGAQAPAPPAAPVAPAAAPVVPGFAGRIAVAGQGGGFGGAFGPGDAVVYGRAQLFGDDPRARDLAKKLVDAKDDEIKEKLRGELKGTLAKAFDERLKGQERQVEDLERQLKRLKETVAKRKEAKAEIVADKLASLEKDARGLGW